MSERFELPDDYSLNVAEQLFDALVTEASLSGFRRSRWGRRAPTISASLPLRDRCAVWGY